MAVVRITANNNDCDNSRDFKNMINNNTKFKNNDNNIKNQVLIAN